jgi:hypothetical protein
MSPVKTAPAALTVDDEQLRAQYLGEVLAVLYPGVVGHDVEDATEYLVVPHARRPRLLVPAAHPRLAAAAVRRYAEPQSRMAKLKRDAVVAALRTGASSVLLRDRLRVTGGPDAIDAYLRGVLGTELHLSVHIGPARANRKPVLQLLAPDGQTFAFAKLGTAPLTRTLVKSEATALTAVTNAGLTGLSAPRLLHIGQWGEHDVLVQSALPVWEPRVPLTAPRLAAAMREVAGCCGTRRSTLHESGYWTRLHGRLTEIAEHEEGGALLKAAERIVATTGRLDLTFGAWHGDWAPWNMASLADTLLVWDWERFAPGVPLGFDALHYALQKGITTAAPRTSTYDAATRSVATMIEQAAELLLPFGVVHRQAVEVSTLLYLIDLAARYVADRQAEAGARLGVLGRWLLPILVARVEEL